MGRVYQHEIGKRHTSNLAARGTIQAQPQMVTSEEEQTIQIAPGEPVPPGFEGEIVKLCEIQVSIEVIIIYDLAKILLGLLGTILVLLVLCQNLFALKIRSSFTYKK